MEEDKENQGVAASSGGRSGGPADPSHSSVSRPSAPPANAWRKDVFPVRVGAAGGPTTKYVAGWVRGLFGMDRRRYFDTLNDRYSFGYVITHLPTGYVLRGVEGPLPLAKQIADELAEADWNFTDPNETKSRSPHVKAVMKRHVECVTSSAFDRPTYVDPPASGRDAQTPPQANP